MSPRTVDSIGLGAKVVRTRAKDRKHGYRTEVDELLPARLILGSPALGLPIALMTSQIVDRMLERREAANRDAYERRLTTAPLSPAQASQERILIEMINLRAWREAKDVYIDPAHGDDRNDGLDEATPIKTMNEARRRWNGCNPDTFGYMHGRPFT